MSRALNPATADAQALDPALVDARQKQIMRAAIKVFGRRDFHEATIKDIAREAGISPGLIYHYFKDKEAVLLSVLLDRLDQYLWEVPAAADRETRPLARLFAAFAAYCGVVDDDKEATVLAFRSYRSLDPERRKHVLTRERDLHALLAGYVRECQAENLLREIDGDLLCSQLASMAHAWALQSWRFQRTHDLEAYVRQSFDLLINGALTSAGKRSAARLNLA